MTVVATRTSYLCVSCRVVEVVFPDDQCEVCLEETRFDGVDAVPNWYRTDGPERARCRAAGER